MLNLRGILFMMLSMACFAIEDTFIKLLSARLPASQILFSIGFIGMMIRKNALIMFMCIELMLNSVNLTFITASRHFGTIEGQISVFFVLVVKTLASFRRCHHLLSMDYQLIGQV